MPTVLVPAGLAGGVMERLAERVEAGMEIQVAPATVKPEEYGYLVGRVERHRREDGVHERPEPRAARPVRRGLEVVLLLRLDPAGKAPLESVDLPGERRLRHLRRRLGAASIMALGVVALGLG